MALAVGLVQSGTWHAPDAGHRPDRRAGPGRRRPRSDRQVILALRKLMRATVHHGAGQAANVGGRPVYGQVGQLRCWVRRQGPAYVLVRRLSGQVAFAVVELTRSPAISAAPLAGRLPAATCATAVAGLVTDHYLAF